jgi:hypothetical protein
VAGHGKGGGTIVGHTDTQLYEMVIDGTASGLDDVDIFASY